MGGKVLVQQEWIGKEGNEVLFEEIRCGKEREEEVERKFRKCRDGKE